VLRTGASDGEAVDALIAGERGDWKRGFVVEAMKLESAMGGK
jgi:hypothetical protein